MPAFACTCGEIATRSLCMRSWLAVWKPHASCSSPRFTPALASAANTCSCSSRSASSCGTSVLSSSRSATNSGDGTSAPPSASVSPRTPTA